MVARLGRWLWPALVAPLISAWALVIVLLVHSHDRDAWMVAAVLATLFGGIQGILLVLADAFLLRLRARLLPMGFRAWLAGLAAPWVTFGLWILTWPSGRLEPPAILIFGPMVATALGLRWLTSPRFG